MFERKETTWDLFSGFTHQPQGLQQGLGGVLRTVSAFAQFDAVISSPYWNAAGDESPDPCHEKLVEDGFLMISNRATAGGPRNEADTTNKIIETSQNFEHIVTAYKPEYESLDHTVDKDFTKSNLDADRVLGVVGDTVRNGLKTLFAALNQQLQCCNRGHFVRIKLGGFVHQPDMQSKLLFDAYLCSQYTKIPPRWVRSKCTIGA